jgi:hypothetical protein
MLMKNFSATIKDIDNVSIMIFTDEEGRDWYESQKGFSKTSLKFMFDVDGNIIASSWDVSMLAPDGLSVSEISKTGVPETFFDEETRWVFDGKKIFPFAYTAEQLLQQAEDQRDRLISDAKEKIIVPQTKLALGRTLSEVQLAQLNAWLDYIDELEALSITGEPVIWPQIPA